jgi:hypothetical protein
MDDVSRGQKGASFREKRGISGIDAGNDTGL